MANPSGAGGGSGDSGGPAKETKAPPEGTIPTGTPDPDSSGEPGASAPAEAPLEPDGPARPVTPATAPPEGGSAASPTAGAPADSPANTTSTPAGEASTSPAETSPAPGGEYGPGSPYYAYGYDSQGPEGYTPYPGEDTASPAAPAAAESSAPAASESSDTEVWDEEDEEGGGPVKPFLEHLEDLRWTLVKSVSAVVIGMIVCLVASNYLVAFLMWPLKLSEKFFQRNRTDVAVVAGTNVLTRVQLEEFGGTNVWGTNRIGSFHLMPVVVGSNTVLALQPHYGEPDVPPPSLVVIKNYGPIEGVMVALKLALYGGLVVASPFVFYFLGAFILPALHVHEKKILFRAVAYGTGLFLLGVAFCYLIVMVLAIGATVEFSRWLGFGADEWRGDAYISFVIKFMLGMGLTFELPVVILVLVKIGILDYEKLKGFRQWAIIGNLVLSAFVTPSGDPFTMLAMALPLQLLYEISVAVAWYWEWKERRKAGAAG
ncbi:MAG: twin-arginine translocase subunit TatC [Verrucomicrobiae bacterium]|nr:twin-arginine translocase subunit TatC [Verrucomicrobiae bacterium]